MTSPSRNDVTGDKIQTKCSTKKYRDGWDAIFGKWERGEAKRSPCCGHCIESDKEEEKNEREIQEGQQRTLTQLD